MANPYEPGTMEYLDYATSAHDKAMAPKKKKKKKIGMKPSNPVGLAASNISGKQRDTANIYESFMTGKPKIKR